MLMHSPISASKSIPHNHVIYGFLWVGFSIIYVGATHDLFVVVQFSKFEVDECLSIGVENTTKGDLINFVSFVRLCTSLFDALAEN